MNQKGGIYVLDMLCFHLKNLLFFFTKDNTNCYLFFHFIFICSRLREIEHYLQPCGDFRNQWMYNLEGILYQNFTKNTRAYCHILITGRVFSKFCF